MTDIERLQSLTMADLMQEKPQGPVAMPKVEVRPNLEKTLMSNPELISPLMGVAIDGYRSALKDLGLSAEDAAKAASDVPTPNDPSEATQKITLLYESRIAADRIIEKGNSVRKGGGNGFSSDLVEALL